MSDTAVKRIVVSLLMVGTWLLHSTPAQAIPAFARKYGLPCSACHQAWPMLNNFGQVFRDNGYQLGNDRDAPAYQQPSYFPIMFRIQPQWHREGNDRVAVDQVPGNAASGLLESQVDKSGFDLSGLDVFSAGTLARNISFAVQPFLGTGGTFFVQGFVRFDNLLSSRWLNVKVGKFELDTLLSEERLLTLNNTGFYYNYHFTPVGDNNPFGGIGSTQLGVELMGHSQNSYTRYSVALVSSNSGQQGLPTNQTYDVYADLSQGFEIPGLGLQRVAAFGYFGQSPTYFQTAGGSPIPGTGTGNRSFYRAGAYGLWYVKKFDFSTFYEHGSDNVFLGNSVPANQPFRLPPGATGPSWNGGFVEAHYTYNPRLILLGRYELLRMSRQASPVVPKDLGNLDSWTVGYRFYPIMNTRAGLAWLQEYSRVRIAGTAPLSGGDDTRSSYLMGFDFDF
jgi:hypothetical protein